MGFPPEKMIHDSGASPSPEREHSPGTDSLEVSGSWAQSTCLDLLQEYRGRPRNIVLYGESGAGKSSLINLIAGSDVARTSPDASVCTTTHTPYEVTIEGQYFRLWDTAGLNEGSESEVPAAKAQKNLTAFLRALKQEDGVHLLVYCMSGKRAAKTLKNHRVFASAICRTEVPVILVVTCLEDFRPVMQSWWDRNKDTVAQHEFSGYACVTTLKDDPTEYPDILKRREQSKNDVCALILEKCSRTPHETWAPAMKGERNRLEILMQKLARFIGIA